MDKLFAVERQQLDAARPWVVVATFRLFNRVVGRYAEKEQAKRRARYLDQRSRSQKEAA